MNLLKLFESNREKVVYEYAPEGEGKFGKIAFLFSKGEAEIVEPAEKDEKNWYAYKAISSLERQIKENKGLPLEFINSWG
ncbi:MAG: hypothetical protein LBL34_00025 [Clostridiales bacterium]|jgi:hypothetical protein|nr:hypothetical protein [Clostridiales bacterium]